MHRSPRCIIQHGNCSSQLGLLPVKKRRLVSKCKLSHSCSLKCEVQKNETDLTATTSPKSLSLIAQKATPMDFYQPDKKVDFAGRCIYHKGCICPTQGGKWSGNCRSSSQDPKPQIIFFFSLVFDRWVR